MSAFGLFHTAVSLLALPLGLYAFARDGKIDPKNGVGKLYLASMLIGTLTAFGFIVSKGFNPAQVLSVLTLVVLLAGMFVSRVHWLGRAAVYVETTAMTFSFLLLMVFTTTETLTRIPTEHPFAANAESAELIPVRLSLLAAFLLGLGYQLFKLHVANGSMRGNRPVAAG